MRKKKKQLLVTTHQRESLAFSRTVFRTMKLVKIEAPPQRITVVFLAILSRSSQCTSEINILDSMLRWKIWRNIKCWKIVFGTRHETKFFYDNKKPKRKCDSKYFEQTIFPSPWSHCHYHSSTPTIKATKRFHRVKKCYTCHGSKTKLLFAIFRQYDHFVPHETNERVSLFNPFLTLADEPLFSFIFYARFPRFLLPRQPNYWESRGKRLFGTPI